MNNNDSDTTNSAYQTDYLRRLENLRAKEYISSEHVSASVEVHEAAVADCEPIFICSIPCLWICTFSARVDVARSNADCVFADYCAVAADEVAGADESLESVQAFDYAELDCIGATIHVSVELAEHCCECSWLENHNALVNWNVVVFCCCIEASDSCLG